MAIIAAIGDSPNADNMAKEAAEILVSAYPNHAWLVEVRQGVLIIKHAEASGMRGRIGMLRKVSQIAHDAQARKKELIRAAGELLERAGLKRGARTDDPVTNFETDTREQAKHWHRPVQAILIT